MIIMKIKFNNGLDRKTVCGAHTYNTGQWRNLADDVIAKPINCPATPELFLALLINICTLYKVL